jgi:hypothetical protein
MNSPSIRFSSGIAKFLFKCKSIEVTCFSSQPDDEFDPGEWYSLSSDAASPYAITAFSGGPRVCVGSSRIWG